MFSLKFGFVLTVFGLVFGLGSAQTDDYISDLLLERLRGGVTVFEYQVALTELRLVPNHDLAERVAQRNQGLKGWSSVEVLTQIPLKRDVSQLELYNFLHAISTMQGISYFSATRAQERELFRSSYVVADASSKEALADPVMTEVLDRDELLILQDDTSFGENLYRAVYESSSTDEALLLTISNQTNVRYNLLRVFAAEQLMTSILVIPQKESNNLLFYGVVSAKLPPIGIVKNQFQESLKNRVVALEAWLKDGLDKMQ